MVPQETTPLLQGAAVITRRPRRRSNRLAADEASSSSSHKISNFSITAAMKVSLTALVVVAMVTPMWLRWRNDETTAPKSIVSLVPSNTATSPLKSEQQQKQQKDLLAIDAQLLQLDEWKHQLTTTTSTMLETNLLQKIWSHVTHSTDDNNEDDGDDSSSTSNSYHHHHHYTHNAHWNKWWNNCTDSEKHWWNETLNITHAWHHSLAHHNATLHIRNETQHILNETKDWAHELHAHMEHWLNNHSATTTTTITTQQQLQLEQQRLFSTGWLSPLGLKTSNNDDDDDDIYSPSYMNHSSAYSLLFHHHHNNLEYSQQYFTYQQGFDVQINQAYCGVASVAALLNSIECHSKLLPTDAVYLPYNYATQIDILQNQPCVNDHVVRYNESFSGILASPYGLSMPQVQALLQCYLPQATVEAHHVTPNSSSSTSESTITAATVQHQRWIDHVRQVLKEALQSDRNRHTRVLINYDRSVVGQVGRGHWSPLVSYHAGRDAFLVLDVAKYKYPPVWIPTFSLVAAMATVDGCSDWNFPQAQDELSPELLHPSSMNVYLQAMKQVKCQANYRGFILVKDINSTHHSD